MKAIHYLIFSLLVLVSLNLFPGCWANSIGSIPGAILSGLRNLVQNGALSLAKAQKSGMVSVHEDEVAALHILFRRLLAAYLVSVELAGFD